MMPKTEGLLEAHIREKRAKMNAEVDALCSGLFAKKVHHIRLPSNFNESLEPSPGLTTEPTN